MYCNSNAMFIRGVTSGPDRVRQRVQARPGDVGLPSVQSRDGAGDDLEQRGGHGSACYIATRTRRSHIIRRVRHFARVPASSRFLARIYAPDRSHILRQTDRTHVRLPAPPHHSRTSNATFPADVTCHFSRFDGLAGGPPLPSFLFLCLRGRSGRASSRVVSQLATQ